MDYASKLNDGGLLLLQFYCGSLDAQYHPPNINACRRQLEQNGLRLCEVHRVSYHGSVMLYAASKAREFSISAEPISQFQRARPQKVERIYPGGIRQPNAVQRAMRLFRHLAASV